jgi:hypothetical protein
MNLSNLKMSNVVKIAAAVGIALVVIMQAITSNKEDKLEQISNAIMKMEEKVSAELETVEKDEQETKAALEKSPSPAATVSPSVSPHGK